MQRCQTIINMLIKRPLPTNVRMAIASRAVQCSQKSLPTFSCEGPLSVEEVSLSPTTINTLTRLLACEDVCSDDRFHTPTVCLCDGVLIVPSVIFVRYIRDSFLLIRRVLNDLLTLTEDRRNDRNTVNMLTQHCVQFLTLLECYTHRWLCVEGRGINKASVARQLLSQLTIMCKYLGTFEESLRALRTHSHTLPLSHLSLHTHWTHAAILYRLTPLLGAGGFVELASHIISSCIRECSVNFDPVNPHFFLPCPCVADLWTLLHFTLDGRPSLTKGFWELVSEQLLLVLAPPTHSTHFTVKHSVVFVWWTLSQLAIICKPHPLATPKSGLANNWCFITDHLLSLTFSGELSEVEVSVCVRCAVRLVVVWGVCPQLLFKTWDHAHKYLNEPSSSGGALEWAPIRDSCTPKQWVEHIVTVTSGQVQTNWSTFELFLSMLPRMISLHSNSGSLWKQLKGRVYSKIHRRWLAELSMCGLSRLCSLYLTLVCVSQSTGAQSEVADKMVSTLLALTGEKMLVWKGLLSLLLFCVQLKHNVTILVSKITPAISNLIGQLSTCESVWDVIAMILVVSMETIELPNAANLGVCNLIGGPQWSHLLSVVEGSRLTKVLSAVEGIGVCLSTLDHPPPTCCRGYLEHCVLALPSHTPSPPHTLHSVAAAGTLLSIQWAEIIGERSYSQHLFADFACSDSTHPYVCSGYLCHVLSNPLMRESLVNTEHAQLATLHSWLRCFLLSNTHTLSCDDHVTELTRQLSQLPLVASLIQECTSEPLVLLRLVLTAMSNRHGDSSHGNWRNSVESVLGDLVRTVQPLLAHTSSQTISRCYAVTGVIVSSCPQLIYSRINSHCLLPQLVDRLLLPLATTRARPTTHIQDSCVRSHLHQFVEGLLSLDPDDFIKRKLRAIISRYLLTYCTPLTPSDTNPFKTLTELWTGDNVSSLKAQQLLLFLDVIATECLQLPRQPKALLPVLVYISELVEVVCSVTLRARICECLLPHLLPPLLACDVCSHDNEPRGIRKIVMRTLRTLLMSCDSNNSTRLAEVLCAFVLNNRNDTVRRTLTSVLTLAPSLTTLTLDRLQQLLNTDQSLRETYQHLSRELSHFCN